MEPARLSATWNMTDERVVHLNDRPLREGGLVLYWMQAAQRVRANPALNYAADLANRLARPLVVCFRLRGGVPGANVRHYAFMLEGLAETAKSVARLGAAFVFLADRDPDSLAGDAAAAVTDCGYLPWQFEWRRRMARAFPCRLTQVETETAVPVDSLSLKEEYAASSLRPKLHRLVQAALSSPLAADAPATLQVRANAGLRLPADCFAVIPANPDALPDVPGISAAVGPVAGCKGGEKEAWRRVKRFLSDKLAEYATASNDPGRDGCSLLSPYLHFGQISPVAIAREVLAFASDLRWPPARRPVRGDVAAAAPDPLLAGRNAFLEQILVRRELAVNFVVRAPAHDRYQAIPAWARLSLEKHRTDPRPYLYRESSLENAATHDRYWNAAQRQMAETGYMHNYMRMYWGKKVLEWTKDPEDAFHLLLRLNDTYQLDGRDPNGYAGVAWCFGKHDRPWRERAVFGKVRYMNAAGLERKFDLDDYVGRYGS